MSLLKFIFVLMLFALSGCAIIGNLDQVFTLMDYSSEKDGQHRLVKTINEHYDALTKVIADGKLNDYKTQDSFTQSFGDPILKRNMNDGTQRWLYRHAIDRFAKDKVYVYFDHDGRMLNWEKVPCPKSL